MDEENEAKYNRTRFREFPVLVHGILAFFDNSFSLSTISTIAKVSLTLSRSCIAGFTSNI